MKRLLIGFMAVLVAAVALFCGVKQYKSWRQSRLVQKAQSCLARADYRNASLCARQAVESDPQSTAACRVMADLAEVAHSTNAVFWRRRVVELEPRVEQNRLMLARTALGLGQQTVAAQALDAVAAETTKTADYHKLRANLNWAVGQFAEAELHFAEAVRLEPNNAVSRMNLSLVRLNSTNDQTSGNARVELKSLATNELVRPDVLRQLSTDATRRSKLDEAVVYSQELLATGSGLADQIRHLGLLHEARRPEFKSYLETLQAQFQTNGWQAAVLGKWMIAAGTTAESLAWLRGLPQKIRDTRPVMEVVAEGLLVQGAWTALAAHLEQHSWEGGEYFRLTLLARASRELRNNLGARSQWLKALQAASGSLERLIQLARTSESWGWRDEMEEALSAIVAQFPEQKWAEDYLSASLHLAGKTQALQNLYGRAMEREPTNNVAKSNYATLGMLLDPGDKRLYKLAEEAFQAQPEDPYIASTYALSLHFQQHTPQALLVMEKLPLQRLEQPVIAAWYGFLLAEAGQPKRAEKYVRLGEKARLLPEEKRLMAKAKSEG